MEPVRTMRKTIFMALLAVALVGVWGGSALATPTPIAPFNESYADPTGDASAGVPDVTGVTAANDIRGLLTFSVTLAATPVLPPGDVVLVAVDSDCRSNTGARATGGGFDDRMALVGLPSGAPGSEFDPYLDGAFRIEREASVLPASFSASFADGVATFTIARSDLGGTAKLCFLALAENADESADSVPIEKFVVGGTTSPLTMTSLIPQHRLRGGKTVLIASRVLLDGRGIPSLFADLQCIGTVDGKPLSFVLPIHVKHPMGTMLCDVTIPKRGSGSVLALTMRVRYRGHTASTTADFRLS